MKTHTVICPYCNAPAVLRPAQYVHGNSPIAAGKHLYVCSNWPKCDAYVSAHNNNKQPMGILANGDLRHKRILAHRALNQYRKLMHMEKKEAYLWLQAKLGKTREQVHIACFTEEMCDKVISLCGKNK